jgi:hypothetical protein
MRRADCQQYVGKYIRFRTPFGYHEGIIERIQGDQAVILSPRRYIPAQFATEYLDRDEVKRLELTQAFGGYTGGAYGNPGRGYGGYPGGGYGAGRGYGGWGGYAWGRWAVSFLIIYLLWGLIW